MAEIDSARPYVWLQWTAAAVLFIEGLLGMLLPVVLKTTVHAGWGLSLVNCFAGSVFFSFGALIMLLRSSLKCATRCSLDPTTHNTNVLMTPVASRQQH